MCQRLKRFLFMFVLLLSLGPCVLSAQSVLVERETLLELQILNNSLNNKLLLTVNSLIQQELEIEKWLGISKQQRDLINNLSTDLQVQEKLLEQISIDYEVQLTTQEELNKSLKAQSLKTSFIVGGVTFGVTVLIAVPLTIYLYDKYFVK